MTSTPDTDTDTSTDSSDTGSSRSSRRGQVGLIASLAVVALVGVGGVAALTLNHGNHNPTAPQAAATLTPATPGHAATGFAVPQVDVFGRRVDVPNNSAGQPLPQTSPQHQPGDSDWLTAAPVMPEKGGWQRVFGASVPFSTSDGPTSTVDGVAAGWAHTPQGAALAANYELYQQAVRPGDRMVRQRLVETTADQMREFDTAKAAGQFQQVAPESLTRYLAAPDAYKVDNYSDDMAVLEFAVRTADDSGVADWLSTQVVVVWDGGDWRLQPPPGGNPPESTLTALTGWTSW